MNTSYARFLLNPKEIDSVHKMKACFWDLPPQKSLEFIADDVRKQGAAWMYYSS